VRVQIPDVDIVGEDGVVEGAEVVLAVVEGTAKCAAGLLIAGLQRVKKGKDTRSSARAPYEKSRIGLWSKDTP
jgi:hypothetical protein